MQNFKELSAPATIVSFVPLEIVMPFKRHTPGQVVVPASPDGKTPSLTVIAEPISFLNQDISGAIFTDYVSPAKVAESVVERWMNKTDITRGTPALWFELGEVEKVSVEQHADRLNKHWRWMNYIVQHGDEQWKRYNKSANSISNLHRACARGVGKSPEWLEAGFDTDRFHGEPISVENIAVQ